MISRHKGPRALLLGALALVALGAFASPAMAEFTTARFDTSTVKTSAPSSLTVEKKGATKTCTLGGTLTTNILEESFYFPQNSWPNVRFRVVCSGSTELQILFFSEAQRDSVTGATRLEVEHSTQLEVGPWGSYVQQEFTVPYTNGSGATPSTIKFNKTTIGELGGGETITLTGTLNVTNSLNQAAKIVP